MIVSTLKVGALGCVAAIMLLAPSAGLAHTFRSDGPVTVLLHVDPQDDPSTNGPSQLNFYVFDSENKFLGTHCNCSVTVVGDGKTILQRSITFNDSGNSHVARVPIAFPSIAVYTINLVGKPKQPTDFHAFNLNYIQRVDRVGYGSNKPLTVGDIAIAAFGVLVVVGAAIAVTIELRKNLVAKG